MKTYLKKHHIHLSAMSLLLLIMTMVGGCADDLLYDPNDWSGDGTISMTLGFEPMYASDLNTRTPGNVIKKLNSLSLVFFDTNGTFVKIINQGDPEIVGDKHRWDLDNETDDNTFDDKTEEHTPKVTFKLQDIPFGKYHIYAVANMGNLTAADVKSTDPTITDEKKLKGTVLEWNEVNVAANAQMFGYFSTNDSRPGDFDAPEIVITKTTPKLYAWVRRAASKVTIAYDGSNLNDDVWVYINKVTIRDIPKTCLLGEPNEPKKKEYLIEEGGTLYYNQDGVVPAGEVAPTDYNQWLTITNDDKEPVGTDHSETAQALFFYENMQGDFKDDANKEKYDKRKEASPKHGVLVNPGDDDYKDEVPYGTYIEVEAYYNSQNPANITSGKIIYRFMLGKDVEYNYNAERNHHFKLTLCFNGWANQADWHIEYTEEDPSIQTYPEFYMPYLYNQQAMFPFKINGELEDLHVEIIENGWAPVYPSTDNVPAQTVGTFTWNLPAYNKFGPNQYPLKADGKPAQYPQLGFLALAVHEETGNPATNIISNKDYRDHTAVDDLWDYYNEEFTTDGYRWSQRQRWYNVAPGTHQVGNNQYIITKADKGEAYNIQIPLWTRNKTMIENSGYTGNNPYEEFERRAVIRITAHVKNRTAPLITEVPIYQVRRLVNPKGIWRSYSDNESFFVHLMTLNSPADTKYTPLRSDGSWTAEIESGDKTFCYLTGDQDKEQKIIEGATDSEIKFYVRFNDKVTSGHSKGCVVSVRYNGGSCVHKILVRQGYDEAVEIVADGAKWSSFNLYSCESGYDGAGYSTVVPAEVSCNPLGIGSLFKRRNYSDAILISNNNTYGPLVALDGKTLTVKSKGGAIRSKTWNDIGVYPLTNNKGGSSGAITVGDIEGTTATRWARFSAIPPGSETAKTYRVPTYDDYNALADAEYAIGVVYADGATGTRDTFDAYQYEDATNNNTLKRSELGMRGYIVYNDKSGNQIFFPLGRYGMARRTQYYLRTAGDRGYLRYAGVYDPLTGDGNLWRPIPYDLPTCPGSVYWIDNAMIGKQYHTDGACGGWDMNYFNLDFSSYSYPNLNDACPVKLIWEE